MEPHSCPLFMFSGSEKTAGHLKARQSDSNDCVEGESQIDVTHICYFCFISVTGQTGIETEKV